ncbi:DegT/DnrJ/EryC1/StrS family aminotransferase [Thalassotalea fusca]
MIRTNVCHWGALEWKAILSSIFEPTRGETKYQTLLVEMLEAQYQCHVVPMNSARAALKIGLDYAGLCKPPAIEVIIPEYICTSVPETILRAGCIPVNVPVDKYLNIDASKIREFINPKTRAVIAPHMYSKPADIEHIETICRENSVFLVDDAAQVAGVEVNGRKLGTFGDMGILSFAQAKTIVTGVQASGGVLFSNNEDLLVYSKKYAASLLPAHSRWPNLIHFLCSYYFQGVFKNLDYYLQRIKQKRTSATLDHYAPRQISELEASIAICQFKSLAQRKCKIKTILDCYRRRMGQFKTFEFIQLTNDINYLSRLIVRTRKLSPEKVIQFLASRGVQAKKAYGRGSEAYDCSSISGLFELPLQNLTESEVGKIIESLYLLEESKSGN